MQPVPVPETTPSHSADNDRPLSPFSSSYVSTAPTIIDSTNASNTEEMPQRRKCKAGYENTESSADETTAIRTRGNNYAATESRRHEEHEEEHSGKWFLKFGAIELENKGSVARDHLALERTFLAWLRTSLAFASIGIAITQLFRLNSSISAQATSNNNQATTLRHMGKPLGATFLGIAIVVLMIGVNRSVDASALILPS
ncbi:hypothetical protein RUND412_000870 [Rhizina undulata]